MTDLNTVNPQRDVIEVCHETQTIYMPHWGLTMRTLFGAALRTWPDPVPGERREYTVVHRDAPVATLYVQQHDEI